MFKEITIRIETEDYENIIKLIEKEKEIRTRMEETGTKYSKIMHTRAVNTLIDYCDDLDVSGYILDAIKESLSKGQ